MFFHGGGTVSQIRFAVPTEIGHDQAVARLERAHNRQPELVMNGKRMEKNYRRPIARDPVEDIRVTAFHPLRWNGRHAYEFVAGLAATGACSINGSSGMMIQAIG